MRNLVLENKTNKKGNPNSQLDSLHSHPTPSRKKNVQFIKVSGQIE